MSQLIYIKYYIIRGVQSAHFAGCFNGPEISENAQTHFNSEHPILFCFPNCFCWKNLAYRSPAYISAAEFWFANIALLKKLSQQRYTQRNQSCDSPMMFCDQLNISYS